MSEEQLLRKIADLVAQRGFQRDPEWEHTILDCVQSLLTKAGYGTAVDVL